MILEVVALLMIVNGEIKEHRIQIDPETNKHSMSMCLKHKRIAKRGETGTNIQHQCIKSMAEVEKNIDGSISIKNLSSNKRNQMAKLLKDRKYKQRVIKSKKVYNRKDKNYETYT